jgi:LPXTG-motif cell wall-anchored protein
VHPFVASGAVVAVPSACVASAALPATGTGDLTPELLAIGGAAIVGGLLLRRVRRPITR